MTTDLRDGLRDVVERTPVAVPPPDLWLRGVRRRRRIRAVAAGATAAAVAAGVLLTTVALDTVRTSDPAPADTPRSGAIPDRLHTPSPWTEGTEEEPPGALAVIAGAERRTGWRGTVVNGWVGVSASTGEYRFLDLPGAVELDVEAMFDWEVEPRLSPDGRAVAYWLAHPEETGWVGGWAVYDTVSGNVVRHPVRRSLGIAPETLAWTGPDRLLVAHGVVTERDGSTSTSWRARPSVLWTPSTGESVEVAGRQSLTVDSAWPTREGLATFHEERLVLREHREGRPLDRLRVDTDGDVQSGAVNAEASRVVLLPHTPDSSVRRLLVGEVPRDAADGDVVPTETLPVDLDLFDLVGWRDPEHVIVRGGLRTSEAWSVAVYAVDVRTGTSDLVVQETRENWIGSPDYADDLWSRATVARPGPDRAYDPRLVTGAGGALVGGSALLLWRRRRAGR